MNNITLVGVDAGNKNLKVLVDGKKNPIIIPNIVTNVKEFKSLSESLFQKQYTNPINCLDVSINSNGKDLGRKYVGHAAVKYGGRERPLNKLKYNDDDILFASLAGIAYALYDPVNPVKTVNVGLGTCLPTIESFDEDQIAEHEKRFIGTHEVTFNDKIFNNAKVIIKIYDDNITTGPEGTIALFNMMTDKEGALLPQYLEDNNELYLVLDIGGGTTDVSAVMNFEPIQELVDSFDRGILHAEESIIKLLRNKNRDYIISKSDLDCDIRNGIYDITFRNDVVNIKQYVDMEFSNLWNFISDQLNNMIQLMPPHLKRYIKEIVLTGGSSILLDKYIEPIAGYDIRLSKFPLRDNVEGCLKAIKLSLEMKEVASGEDELYEQN